MNDIRRLSLVAAHQKAEALALQLIRETSQLGWISTLKEIKEDPILQTKVGKTPRHWIGLVEHTKVGGGAMDGPAVIKLDLERASAHWA